MNNKNAPKNLIPNSQRTAKERQEIARKGGIASGKARREYKKVKSWAEAVNYQLIEQTIQTDDGSKVQPINIIVARLTADASKGNTRAAKLLAELNGGITQKHEVNADVKASGEVNHRYSFEGISPEELADIVDKLQQKDYEKAKEAKDGKG